MTYIPTGDVSPAEARIGQLTTFIISRRKLGMSDSDIRTYLRLPGPLPASHPCAGTGGQNLCADWEVTQAFGNASLANALASTASAGGKVDDKGGGLAGLLSVRNIVIAAVAVLAVTGFVIGRKK